MTGSPPRAGARPPDSPEHREATGHLVAATRSLMRHASTTQAAPEVLHAAALAVERAVALLGEAGPRVRRAPLDADAIHRMRAGTPWTVAPFNPMTEPISITIEGDRARAELLPGALHEGPPGLVHGGFAAHLLDAVLGLLVQVQAVPGYTAGLDLAYRRPTLLDRPIVVEAVMGEVSGRKMLAHGWISQDGERTVEAAGLFVRRPD